MVLLVDVFLLRNREQEDTKTTIASSTSLIHMLLNQERKNLGKCTTSTSTVVAGASRKCCTELADDRYLNSVGKNEPIQIKKFTRARQKGFVSRNFCEC